MDSLVEIIAFAELTPAEQEEFEMAYWAWWEQIKRKVLQNHF
ncbi:MAG: hypothetical protein RMM17_13745 [Acidobacteriota bacterium]|nr:hypothetical protein [Blastocatellia bacterium]MDW8413731.1 hypothetical protein [Acidobacteriota bacterium]